MACEFKNNAITFSCYEMKTAFYIALDFIKIETQKHSINVSYFNVRQKMKKCDIKI